MSRRDEITMAPGEVQQFLDEQRTLTCATLGPKGWPHVMPLWYVVRDGEVWAWTYAKSQKVRNLERDPRATLQVEAGQEYSELRGVMIEADTVVHRDLATVSALGVELLECYAPGASAAPGSLDAVNAQAAKRVGLRFVARRTASWDHRKLAARS
jgi:PPOX class probable F420-dependent enzyme